MWIVYLIQNTDTKEVYFGLTGNIKKRLQEHNSGSNSSTRRLSGKWNMIYCECYRSKEDAVKRERRIKQHGRAKQEIIKRVKSSLL